jgi:hypothetical protein
MGKEVELNQALTALHSNPHEWDKQVKLKLKTIKTENPDEVEHAETMANGLNTKAVLQTPFPITLNQSSRQTWAKASIGTW